MYRQLKQENQKLGREARHEVTLTMRLAQPAKPSRKPRKKLLIESAIHPTKPGFSP